MLDESSVVEHLRRRGVVAADEHVVAIVLGGGVSNVVLSCDGPETGVVVKQSLEKLRVAQDWRAPRERIVREAEGLALVAELLPDAVPRVIDFDPENLILTIERADDAQDWKARLRAGSVDLAIAARLGEILGTVQTATEGGARLPQDLADDTETFEVLRLEPYHATAAAANPDLAAAIAAVADRMRGTRRCLVHGDFSPKNVLLTPGGVWLIDFEVAHLGDPTFDTAFLLSHLMMKAIAQPDVAVELREASAVFLAARAEAGPEIDEMFLARQIGCLLIARVDGKSPAEYLDEAARTRVRALGRALLTEPVAEVAAWWDMMEEQAE